MNLPTKADIDLNGSLEEQTAVEHFLGLDVTAAIKLFDENCLVYQEDLMWMGPVAFCFYFDAFFAHVKEGCDECWDWFLGVVRFQLKHSQTETAAAHSRIQESLDWMLAEADADSFDPKVRAKLEREIAAIKSMMS